MNCNLCNYSQCQCNATHLHSARGVTRTMFPMLPSLEAHGALLKVTNLPRLPRTTVILAFSSITLSPRHTTATRPHSSLFATIQVPCALSCIPSWEPLVILVSLKCLSSLSSILCLTSLSYSGFLPFQLFKYPMKVMYVFQI